MCGEGGSFRTMESKRPWPGFLLGTMRRHWKSGASLWQDGLHAEQITSVALGDQNLLAAMGERSEKPFSQVTRAKGHLSLSSEKRVCLLGS